MKNTKVIFHSFNKDNKKNLISLLENNCDLPANQVKYLVDLICSGQKVSIKSNNPKLLFDRATELGGTCELKNKY